MNTDVPDDWLLVLSADDARDEDRMSGVPTGNPIYLSPGTLYIYWKDPNQALLRGVYNIPPDLADEVVERIEENRSASYLDLIGDVQGTGYADQMTKIEIVE